MIMRTTRLCVPPRQNIQARAHFWSIQEQQEATHGTEMDIRDIRAIIIQKEKILDYLLSPVHSKGQGKAEFFGSLGYHQLLWRTLEHDIRNLAPDNLIEAGANEYGVKFIAKGIIVGPNGKSARILTVWMVYFGDDVLKFITLIRREKPMAVKLLDLIVLEKDLPEHGLERGDVGTAVELYPDGALEVEFVTTGGYTQALITLHPDDFRPATPDDMLCVRPRRAA